MTPEVHASLEKSKNEVHDQAAANLEGESSTNRKIKTVIFDFDFTLADSAAAAVDCINFALSALGLPKASAEEIHQTIGLPLSDTLLKLAGWEYVAQCDEFARSFRKRADEIMADMTVIFDTVPKTVTVLKQYGLALGIVSTKGRFRILAVLEREKLLDSFEVIVGGEDVPEYKPDPQGLLAAVRQVGCSPSNSLYVGDSVIDAETATRAGIPFIAVLTGVTSEESFRSYPVCGIINSLLELPELIRRQASS